MSCTDPVAFAAFEAKERGKALKYAAAWVGADAAQDVVQDGLLVVWQKWETLTNPAGYLYRTCKQLAFGEYEARDRDLALLAKLPEQPHLDDDDQAEPPMGAAMLNLAVELTEQVWSSPRTIVVGLNLAEGHSRAEIAQFLQLPLSEVHRAARELRRYYKARRTDPRPTGSNAYTPHGLVMRAMRRLSRREREVMALAALGLRPHLIAPLIGITGGSARTTLCHARKAVIDATGFLMEDDGLSEVIDHFVKDSLDTAELLSMLPDLPWKTAGLRRAATEDAWSRRRDLLLDLGEVVGLEMEGTGMKMPPSYRYLSGGTVPYLTEISKVIAVVREGLEAPEPIAAYGSVRWTHPGMSARAWDHDLRMRVAAYCRLQATHAPYLKDPVLMGDKKAAPNPSAYFCPVPSWPAAPPRYLTLASPPPLPNELAINIRMLRTKRAARREALDRHRFPDRSRLAAAA